jgi:UDP-N-acetyl-D-mannosaminuronic acid dehydrogenase
MKNMKDLFVPADSTIKNAMEVINDAPKRGLPGGICCVVDDKNRLLGVVTDGNIRRGLMSGVDMESSVRDIMTEEPITVHENFSSEEMLRSMFDKVRQAKHIRDRKVDNIIVVGRENQVVDIRNFMDLLLDSEVHFKSIAIIGMGYVGLTLGLTLAEAGLQVYGIESDDKVKRLLANGKPHFHEIGLASLLKHQAKKGTFNIADNLDDIVADVYIIAVGTPLDNDRAPNMRFIEDAAQGVGEKLKSGDLIILRSTVPVGTTRNAVLPILERISGLKGGKEFRLAFAPERTIEGKALEECRTLPQVIGGLDARSVESAAKLFRRVTRTIVQVESLEAAEMVKLVNNCFRDLRFAFANEMALLCDRIGVNANDVINAANEGYPRDKVPVPSPGVGGACLTKDPYIYSFVAKQHAIASTLSEMGRHVNESIPLHVANKILNFFKENELSPNSKIIIMGFAFKGDPETSDMRNSTTIDVLNLLKPHCENIVGYDPVVKSEEIESLGVTYQEVSEGCRDASVIMIMNNHKRFRNLPISDIVESMSKPGYIFDPWQIFAKEDVVQKDGIYHSGLSL